MSSSSPDAAAAATCHQGGHTKSLVVYESKYGNTHALADIIGKALGAPIVDIDAPEAMKLDQIDLLVVGGTQAHGVSPGMRTYLNALSSGAGRSCESRPSTPG